MEFSEERHDRAIVFASGNHFDISDRSLCRCGGREAICFRVGSDQLPQERRLAGAGSSDEEDTREPLAAVRQADEGIPQELRVFRSRLQVVEERRHYRGGEAGLCLFAAGRVPPARITQKFVHLIDQPISLLGVVSAQAAPHFPPRTILGVKAQRVAERQAPPRPI